jgi:hypothetical protein
MKRREFIFGAAAALRGRIQRREFITLPHGRSRRGASRASGCGASA